MEETIDQEEAQQLPPVDFISYLTNLVETGRLYLEGIPNPETEEGGYKPPCCETYH